MCCLSGSRWRGRIAPVTSLAAIPGIHPWPRPGPREGADGDCGAKLKGCRRLGTALAGASPPAGAWRRPWAASATELSERRAEFPARADAKLGKHLAQVPFDGADGQEQPGGNMSSSFAASTCRTALALFRKVYTPTPRLCAATRQIKYSKNVGTVGLEPTNPSLVRRNCCVAGRRPAQPEGPASCADCRWTSPCVAWRLPALAPP